MRSLSLWILMSPGLLALMLTACTGGMAGSEGEGVIPAETEDSATGGEGGVDSATDTAPPPPLERAVVVRGEVPANLLVISIDTLRRDFIGALSGRDTTPFLDSLIAEGVVLEDHASCANWTLNALLCAQTGRYSVDLGVHPEMGGDLSDAVSGAGTLDLFLKQQGFGTALSTANAYFQSAFGLGQGWDSVAVKSQWVAEETFESALAQHGELASSGEPWYLHVHLLDPHTPYTASSVFERGTETQGAIPFDLSGEQGFDDLRRSWGELDAEEQALVLQWIDVLYAAELRSLDEAIRTFLEALATRGGLDDTLVVFWSDHGEQFYEDDGQGHGLNLHDEEVDAFVLFWMADAGLESGVYSGQSTHIDLAPTLFDLLALPPNDKFDGEIVGLASPERGRLAAHWNQRSPAMSWQVGDDKLIYRWNGSVSLFERDTDRGEQEDVSLLRPRKVGRLWAELQPQVEKMLAIHPSPKARDPRL